MNSPLHILCMKFETKTVFLENQNICGFFIKGSSGKKCRKHQFVVWMINIRTESINNCIENLIWDEAKSLSLAF